MPQEATKASHSTPEAEKHKQLDRGVRELVSAITHRLADLHKPGSSHHLEDENDYGFSVITLAGTNAGATMRRDSDEKSSPTGVSPAHQPDTLGTYVNSNYQAVNNSIMLDSRYNTSDPGVHLEISDVPEPHAQKPDKQGKKEARKDKLPVNNQSELSD